MRKIKLKLTPQLIIELAAIIQHRAEVLSKDILLDPKEISIYRFSNCIAVHRRLAIMSLRITLGKFSTLSFSLPEQLTIRYCLLHCDRGVELQEIFTTIDKSIHPSMFERNERFA